MPVVEQPPQRGSWFLVYSIDHHRHCCSHKSSLPNHSGNWKKRYYEIHASNDGGGDLSYYALSGAEDSGTDVSHFSALRPVQQSFCTLTPHTPVDAQFCGFAVLLTINQHTSTRPNVGPPHTLNRQRRSRCSIKPSRTRSRLLPTP